MQFNSIAFAVFFPLVLLIYYIIPGKLRRPFLLVASYFFYMSWNPVYGLLLGGSTLVTYIGALFIEKSSGKGRTSLVVTIVLNLLCLFIFKYSDFALSCVDSLLGLFGVQPLGIRLELELPVGISFFTFQALGYVIDVYRHHNGSELAGIKAEHNIINYALFVSFFPQLVAGPIERSSRLIGNIRELHTVKVHDLKRFRTGLYLIVWGLFMKMVIADRASLLVNPVFEHCRSYGSVELVIAVVAFSIQIYCDFASYSLIAKGAARIMGVELMDNFTAPYLSKSIKEFWGRWHISLSSWFRDYLYIPLGGNRKGARRTLINLLIVFLVSGLWHGASWTFVIWGGIHGLFQIASILTSSLRKRFTGRFKIKTDCFSYRLFQTLICYGLVCFAWIFFRADSLSDAVYFIRQIFLRPDSWMIFNGGLLNLGLDRKEINIFVLSLMLLVFVDMLKYRRKCSIDSFLEEQNGLFAWGFIVFLTAVIFVFGKYGQSFDPQQFIYFQF